MVAVGEGVVKEGVAVVEVVVVVGADELVVAEVAVLEVVTGPLPSTTTVPFM